VLDFCRPLPGLNILSLFASGFEMLTLVLAHLKLQCTLIKSGTSMRNLLYDNFFFGLFSQTKRVCVFSVIEL